MGTIITIKAGLPADRKLRVISSAPNALNIPVPVPVTYEWFFIDYYSSEPGIEDFFYAGFESDIPSMASELESIFSFEDYLGYYVLYYSYPNGYYYLFYSMEV
jgi:hypothetical protein